MISITDFLNEQVMDAAQADQRGLNRWTGEPEDNPAHKLVQVNKLRPPTTIGQGMKVTPDFDPKREELESFGRQLTAQAQANKLNQIKQDLHGEYDRSANQAVVSKGARVVKKTMVGQPVPTKKIIGKTTDQNVPVPKSTSAWEDLKVSGQKIGSAAKKGAEATIDTTKKGISTIGKAIAENPGTTAGVLGAGLAAGYLGKKIFGKPATARA
jgi:hypothetical protein